MKFTWIIALLWSLILHGQIDKTKLVNPKTGAYIFYTGNSHDVKSNQPIHYFCLISPRSEKTTKEHIGIATEEKAMLFIDSLKKNGFKRFAGKLDLTGKYQFNIQVDSVKIHRIDGTDTIFRFTLLINIIKPDKKQLTFNDVLYGDKKTEILDVIRNQLFNVNIDKIKKTRLLEVSIESFVLTNPYRFSIFLAGYVHSIYLLDKD